MISFFICVGVLVLGYYTYGVVCERIFGIDRARPTPAMEMADGVDYVPLPRWKSFLIQFLNIAGLGPIFGAVAGAMWGPVAFTLLGVGLMVFVLGVLATTGGLPVVLIGGMIVLLGILLLSKKT